MKAWPFFFVGSALIAFGLTIGDFPGKVIALFGVLVCVFSIVFSVHIEVPQEAKG